MNETNFYGFARGTLDKYDLEKHKNLVYFAEDKGLILMNGKVYSGDIGDVIGIEKFVKTKDELNSIEPVPHEGDLYFVKDDGLIYEKTEGGWDNGTQPKKNVIYNHRQMDESGRSNVIYRWDGLNMVEISESLVIGEDEGTAYDGAKGKKNAEDIAELQTKYENLNKRLLLFEEWHTINNR